MFLATIDAKGTLNGIGIVAVVTPGTQKNKPVPKVNVITADIAAVGRINVQYAKISRQNEPQLDLLWKTSLVVRFPRPVWSVMM